MKKMGTMIVRVGLLLAMVVAGFLVAFPEWWDLRDFQRLEREENARIAANSEANAALKAQTEHDKYALFSPDRFPDANFLSCLLAQGKDSLRKIVTLDCSNMNIADVTGVSDLYNLTRFNISGNRLTGLDLSKNKKLFNVYASDGLITQVQLPHELLLEADLSGNQLSVFSLTGATQLKKVDLSNNQLTTLHLTESAILDLWAEGNKLTSVMLSNLENLRSLNLRDNQLPGFDLGQLSTLSYVDLSQNPLQNIEIGPMQNLKQLFLTDTQVAPGTLTTLRKKIPACKIVSTQSLSESIFPDPVFRRCVEKHLTDGLASLNKIKCDRYEMGFLSDNATIRNVEGIGQLLALKEVSLLGHEIAFIDVSDLSLLENLNISKNKLKELDLSNNSELQSVHAANNHIERLNFQNNEQLELVSLSNNKLHSLDLSQIPNIKSLRISNNLLESLDTSNSQKIKMLFVDNNQLHSLVISSLSYPSQLSFTDNPLDKGSINRLRQQFWADYPELSDDKVFSQPPKFPVFTLEAAQFPDDLFRKCVETTVRNAGVNSLDEIGRLDCSYQDIGNLEGLQLLTGLEYLILQGIKAKQVPLSNHPSLSNLLITELPLETLDLTGLAGLKTITLNRNQSLRNLKLPENHSIQRIVAQNNALESLWVPDGKFLEWLELKNNKLWQISFGQLGKLIKIDVSDNQLSKIDVRSLVSLKKLFVTRNKLSKIDLSQNPELEELALSFNQIESLSLDQNANLEELAIFNNLTMTPNLSHMHKLKTLAIDESQLNDMTARNALAGFENETKISDSVFILSRK